jgi:hypothetical protein
VGVAAGEEAGNGSSPVTSRSLPDAADAPVTRRQSGARMPWEMVVHANEPVAIDVLGTGRSLQ